MLSQFGFFLSLALVVTLFPDNAQNSNFYDQYGARVFPEFQETEVRNFLLNNYHKRAAQDYEGEKDWDDLTILIRLKRNSDLSQILNKYPFSVQQSFPDEYFLLEINNSSKEEKENLLLQLLTEPTIIEIKKNKRLLISDPLKSHFEPPRKRMTHQESRPTISLLDTLIANLSQNPLFSEQWHFSFVLGNMSQELDAGILGAKALGWTGKGVNVVIVDDSLEIRHPDFDRSRATNVNYDFVRGIEDPSPSQATDMHGTSVAGILLAQNNNLCNVGASVSVGWSGIRLFSGGELDSVSGYVGLRYRLDINDIYVCSWSLSRRYERFDLADESLTIGTLNGRVGRGALYVFSSGNQGASLWNCNQLALQTNPYVFVVGALDITGKAPKYSVGGHCLSLVAPSSTDSAQFGIPTTANNGTCRKNFGGTSASAPIVASVMSLVLEVNKAFSWRDVHSILYSSAVRVDSASSSWKTNGAGIPYSPVYGFGLANATAAVLLAQSWTPLAPQVLLNADNFASLQQSIPETDQGYTWKLSINQSRKTEQVMVQVNGTFFDFPLLVISLTSPNHTTSQLKQAEDFFPPNPQSFSWSFKTLFHWGEDSQGDWEVNIRFSLVNSSRNGANIVTGVRLTVFAGKQIFPPTTVPASTTTSTNDSSIVHLLTPNPTTSTSASSLLLPPFPFHLFVPLTQLFFALCIFCL